MEVHAFPHFDSISAFSSILSLAIEWDILLCSPLPHFPTLILHILFDHLLFLLPLFQAFKILTYIQTNQESTNSIVKHHHVCSWSLQPPSSVYSTFQTWQCPHAPWVSHPLSAANSPSQSSLSHFSPSTPSSWIRDFLIPVLLLKIFPFSSRFLAQSSKLLFGCIFVVPLVSLCTHSCQSCSFHWEPVTRKRALGSFLLSLQISLTVLHADVIKMLRSTQTSFL